MMVDNPIPVFVGDLDIDEYRRVRVFLNSSHDPHEEELELSLYADQIQLTTYAAGEVLSSATLSYDDLMRVLKRVDA